MQNSKNVLLRDKILGYLPRGDTHPRWHQQLPPYRLPPEEGTAREILIEKNEIQAHRRKTTMRDVLTLGEVVGLEVVGL